MIFDDLAHNIFKFIFFVEIILIFLESFFINFRELDNSTDISSPCLTVLIPDIRFSMFLTPLKINKESKPSEVNLWSIFEYLIKLETSEEK